MLNLLNFDALVQRFAAAARASANTVLDFTVGSVWRAIAEANAAVGLWLQWLILVVLGKARLATSQGADVDSFVGDFGLTRLPAVPSTGQVTLARYTAGLAASIPVGTSLKSTDGTQLFAVIADPTNPAYNATTGAYALAANALSITVAAQSADAGTAANAQPGTITVLASAIPGVDTVTNSLAFTGGQDAESDTALRARFALFIQGLSKGTLAAVASAVASVQQGLTFYLAANVDTSGAYRPGNFVLTVDDGSGAPSTALLNSVYTAVDAVRAVGETFSVQAPSVTSVTVVCVLTAAPGYAKANLQGPVATAMTAYINGLGVGSPLLYGALYRTAYDAVPGVGTITGLTVNGGQADIAVTPSGIIKAGTVSVN